MSEKKIKILICTVLFSFFLIIIFVSFFILNKEETEEEIHESIVEEYKKSEIYDFSEYQSIYECMSQYFITLNEDTENILNLLFLNYRLEHNITISNLESFVEQKYDFYSYQINDIQKYYNPYYVIYYINGNYHKESFEEILETTNIYHILIMDLVNNTFAVIPLLKENKSFEELLQQYHFNFYDQEIESNSLNLVPEINVTDFNESMYYYGKFINLIMNDCESAYRYIDDQSKKIYSNLSDFRKICNMYMNKNSSVVMVEYEIENIDGKQNISVTDSYSMKYVFIVNSLNEYKVKIESNESIS